MMPKSNVGKCTAGYRKLGAFCMKDNYGDEYEDYEYMDHGYDEDDYGEDDYGEDDYVDYEYNED